MGYNKYGNRKTIYRGEKYDSAKEAHYALDLDLLILGKVVTSYERQVPYILTANGKKIGKYLLDFKVLYGDGHIEYVDVKGMKTALYKWKKKHVEAEHGITITEV